MWVSGVIYACKKYGLTDAGRGGEAVYVVAIPFSRLSLEVEIKATGPNFSRGGDPFHGTRRV